MPRSAVVEALSDLAMKKTADGTAQDRWFAQAGLTPPLGRMSQRAAADILRMASVYGIYDPDAQTLTDLGQVLRIVTNWREGASPFNWNICSRFIGIRVLLGADGDIILTILRDWPSSGLLAVPSAQELLSSSLLKIAAHATASDDKVVLIEQASKWSEDSMSDRAQREWVNPHFEPLRELDYVRRPDGSAGYQLTERGHRFKSAIPVNSDSEAFLRSGLSSAFLVGEGSELIGPAPASALQATLRSLPARLRGAHAEAPLEPIVLLTQARLIAEKPGLWIDFDSARQLINEMTQQTGGKIALKSGTRVDEPNITWTDEKNLKRSDLWTLSAHPLASSLVNNSEERTAIPSKLSEHWPAFMAGASVMPVESPLPSASSPRSSGGGDSQASGTVLSEPASAAGLVASNAPSPAGGSVSPAGGSALPASGSVPPASGSAPPAGGSAPPADGSAPPAGGSAPPAGGSVPPAGGSAPPAGGSALPAGGSAPPAGGSASPPTGTPAVASALTPQAHLWLSYVERLLRPPLLGDIAGVRRGGPLSWLVALRRALDIPEDKLKARRRNDKEDLATGAIRTWTRSLDGAGGSALIEWCLDQWRAQDVSVDDLRGALLWAGRQADRLRQEMAQEISTFLAASRLDWNKWPVVSELTSALVGDALHLGLWHAEELHLRLKELVCSVPSQAAEQLLRELTATSNTASFDFTQEFVVPESLANLLAQMSPEEKTLTLDEATADIAHSASSESLAPGTSCISVNVRLAARTVDQATLRGREYCEEAVGRLVFLEALKTTPTADPSTIRVVLQGDGRLINSQGQQCIPRCDGEIVAHFAVPDAVGFRRSPPVDPRLRQVVQTLPALAAVDRGLVVDGRARLSRSLHWLALADGPELRPAERLSHAWVAFEHLFADGEQRGHLVAELASPVVALCFLRSRLANTYREALCGLHISACIDHSSTNLGNLVGAWLGSTFWTRYVQRGVVSNVPFFEEQLTADEECVSRIVAKRSELEDLATAIEARAPLAAWQVRETAAWLSRKGSLETWLQRTQREIAHLFSIIYDIRNQLVHDANPFGFDETYRLRDLYERYRLLVNPTVAEALRIVALDLSMPLKDAWALLRARYSDLRARYSKSSIDVETLLQCLGL